MENVQELQEIVRHIMALKENATALLEKADKLPALERNVRRILASLKMLEIDFIEPLALRQGTLDIDDGNLRWG